MRSGFAARHVLCAMLRAVAGCGVGRRGLFFEYFEQSEMGGWFFDLGVPSLVAKEICL